MMTTTERQAILLIEGWRQPAQQTLPADRAAVSATGKVSGAVYAALTAFAST